MEAELDAAPAPQRLPRAHRPLRPTVRARRVRGLVRRQHQGRSQADRSSSLGIGALCNMEHRGATGAEADTGDGAGILIQVPDRFLRARSPASICRRGCLRGWSGVPAGRCDRRGEGPVRRSRRSSPRKVCARSAGATCPCDPDCLGADRPRGDARFPSPVRQRPARRHRDRPRPQAVRRAQAHRARPASRADAPTSPRSAVAP